MSKISNVEIKPLGESIYVKPVRMHFEENGKKRTWDLVGIHDSVAIIIYNVTRNVVILVKQFRPAVYYSRILSADRQININSEKYPAELGMAIELCAGIVDKQLPLIEIAKEEILEETGYLVSVDKIEFVSSYIASVARSSSLQTLYYCEVTDEMKVSKGGGVGDEFIEIIEMKISELRKYIGGRNISSPPSFMFAIYWFLVNKAKGEEV